MYCIVQTTRRELLVFNLFFDITLLKVCKVLMELNYRCLIKHSTDRRTDGNKSYLLIAEWFVCSLLDND